MICRTCMSEVTDQFKKDLKNIERGLHSPGDGRVKWSALVKTVMNLCFHKRRRTS
jgi:hypothetical protein